jgi:hypothetical protein
VDIDKSERLSTSRGIWAIESSYSNKKYGPIATAPTMNMPSQSLTIKIENRRPMNSMITGYHGTVFGGKMLRTPFLRTYKVDPEQIAVTFFRIADVILWVYRLSRGQEGDYW